MLGDDRGGRRLGPPQSIFGHAIRDRLHLVRSDALELRRVRLRRVRPRWRHSRRAGGGNEMDRENSMRAIGLVLLSIAIMALLLTDADAKRRSSAQGSQAAGGSGSWCATYPDQGLNDNCSYSSFNQCYQTVLGRGGFCRPNPFPGTAYGTGHSWSSGPPR